MVDASLSQTILADRHLAYALLDARLRVVAVQGPADLLPPDSLGRSLFDLAPELIGLEPDIEAVLAGQRPRFTLDWVNRETPSGETIYVHLILLPFHLNGAANGQPNGLIHLVEDVTASGLLQQALTQHRNELRLLRDRLAQQNSQLAAANAELRQLDELKSRFVSIAAHELRSPLTAITGYLELLTDEQSDPLTAEQREYLHIIERGITRLLTIINNLLDLTRIEAGRIELALRPYNLAEMVAWVVEELRPTLVERGLKLTIQAPPDLPPTLCDVARAPQILSNLLSNAIKYSYPGGEIEIRLSHRAQEGFVQVAVADQGVGIPLADQPNLFTRFYRASTASHTGATGAGLGLYISRLLVELHGGQLWLDSEVGRGSTFYVTFHSS
ncbi:MAG: HAMP domain-containing histidine kinase [Anaerolineae bacterium]|nr:HAMP domain-containing histidine kinase [Anaerolineae bacterium]